MEHVFLDTSVYIAEQFFHSWRMEGLMKAVDEGYVRVLLPEITEREVYEHLESSLDEFLKKREKVTKSNYVNALRPDVAEIVDKAFPEIADKVRETVKQRFNSEGFIRIPLTNEIDIVTIVDKYFKKQKPFSDKKKNEFPDAITLDALRLWTEKNKQCCAIIARDGDLSKINTEWLRSFDFDKYLENILKIQRTHPSDEERKKLMALLNQTEDIESAIRMVVEDSFDEDYIYCECLNIPEVLSFQVKDIDFDIDGDSIRKLPTFDEDSRSYSFSVSLYVTVEVEHDDYETGYYDSEDDKWFFFDEKCHSELEFELGTTIEISTDTDYEDLFVEVINDSKMFGSNEIIRAYEERY